MKHTILLIDDDSLILKTLKDRLNTWDTEVYSAQTPEEAKEFLGKITPELIVLDLLLAKEDDSTGIIEYMKSTPALADLPIIVLTNLEKSGLQEELASKGIREYLIKGKVGLDELEEKIKSYLEP
jgi:CheY-like chemotaxis protein